VLLCSIWRNRGGEEGRAQHSLVMSAVGKGKREKEWVSLYLSKKGEVFRSNDLGREIKKGTVTIASSTFIEGRGERKEKALFAVLFKDHDPKEGGVVLASVLRGEQGKDI